MIEYKQTQQKDLKAHEKVINDMILTHALLEAFEPWFSQQTDLDECKEHRETSDYLIPKFKVVLWGLPFADLTKVI